MVRDSRRSSFLALSAYLLTFIFTGKNHIDSLYRFCHTFRDAQSRRCCLFRAQNLPCRKGLPRMSVSSRQTANPFHHQLLPLTPTFCYALRPSRYHISNSCASTARMGTGISGFPTSPARSSHPCSAALTLSPSSTPTSSCSGACSSCVAPPAPGMTPATPTMTDTSRDVGTALSRAAPCP